MAGIFISFEGPDGSGKSSALQALIPRLEKAQERKVQLTREPGGGPISEQIRKVILDVDNTDMDPWTEAILYAASRRQHIVDTLKPALLENRLILSDRYLDSSMVYQGVGRNLGMEEVYHLNQYATQGLMPDLTLLFDVPSEIGLKRIQNHRDDEDINRLDLEGLVFHQSVRKAYLELAERFKDRIVIIDASQPLEDVIDDSFNVIQTFIQKESN